MMSGVLNILYLTGSFFMLEVYDRVIPSKSLPTLIGLCVIVAVLYMGQAVLDLIRNRICNRLGDSLNAKLGRRIYNAIIRLPLKLRSNGDSLQPIRDLDQVRSFFSVADRWPSSTFRSCRSTSLFAFCSTSGSAWVPDWYGPPDRPCLSGRGQGQGPDQGSFRLATPGTRWSSLDAVMPRYSRLWARIIVTDRWTTANQAYLLANRQANDAAKGIGAITKAIRAEWSPPCLPWVHPRH